MAFAISDSGPGGGSASCLLSAANYTLDRSSQRVVRNQKDDRTNRCDKKTMHVQAVDALMPEIVKKPSADNGAHDSEQDVEHHAFATMIHQMAGDESGDESEQDPNEE